MMWSKRGFALLFLPGLLVVSAVGQGYRPKEGFVRDSATAIQIAEAVLTPIYGKALIESERPFSAQLKDGVWTVSGTLNCPDGHGGTATDCVGGVAVIKISKADARVLSVIHYK
jgi:hypothetical protein